MYITPQLILCCLDREMVVSLGYNWRKGVYLERVSELGKLSLY